MVEWRDLFDGVGLFVLLVALGLAALYVRRRLLSRTAGTFECSLRMQLPTKRGAAAAARGWVLGLARYSDTTLEWFRVFSLAPRPKYTFGRSLTVVSRRHPAGAEAFSLYGGHIVVRVETEPGRSIELAMSEGALTGFLAWIEAAPPTHDRIFE